MIFRRSGPVLLRNPIFCDFSGGGGRDPLSTPLWIHACNCAHTKNLFSNLSITFVFNLLNVAAEAIQLVSGTAQHLNLVLRTRNKHKPI